MQTALTCRHCSGPIAPDAERCPKCGGLTPAGKGCANIALAIVVLLVGGIAAFWWWIARSI